MLAAYILDRVAYLVYYAKQNIRLGEDALYCIRETGKTIYASYKGVLYTTVLEVCQDAEPEVSPLTMGTYMPSKSLCSL